MRYSVLYFAWDNIQSVTQEQGYYKSNSGRQLKLTQNIKFIEFEKKSHQKSVIIQFKLAAGNDIGYGDKAWSLWYVQIATTQNNAIEINETCNLKIRICFYLGDNIAKLASFIFSSVDENQVVFFFT